MKGLIPPWYRSVLFWLGVPGFLFLLWAWGDSNRTRRTACFHSDNLISTQGKVFWHRIELANQSSPKADWLITDVVYDVHLDFREGDVSVVPEPAFPESSPFQNIRMIRMTPRFGVLTEPVILSELRWFPPLRWRWEQLDAKSRYGFISLPYWLLIAGYAGIWATTALLWQRRKAHLLLRHSAALTA